MDKYIKVIIEHLDSYLTRTGVSHIAPVEANEILARAKLLRDNKERPGKPLRDLLRKGQLPHAFQSGGKGSAWIIPHSIKRSSSAVTIKPIAIKIEQQTQIIKASVTNVLQLQEMLMDEKNFKSADGIDNLVPHNSGLYCIRITDINKLPKPFNTFLTDRQHNIIYIGIATNSLNRRFLNQELRANGHGTFFRSIGALLGYRPPKGSLKTKKNKRNYKFASADERVIIKWINDNLIVNWIELTDDLSTLETQLISKYKPLINLVKNSFTLRELSKIRKECVQIANQQ